MYTCQFSFGVGQSYVFFFDNTQYLLIFELRSKTLTLGKSNEFAFSIAKSYL
jgi:hypothetical protein